MLLFCSILFTMMDNISLSQVKWDDEDIMYKKQAPDFMVKTIDNEDISLKDFKGKVVILLFWISGKNTLDKFIKDLDSTINKFKGNKSDLQVISVSLDDSLDKVMELLGEKKISAYRKF